MSFVSTVINNDGTSALLMGNGDPIDNSITPPTGITNAIYLNTSFDARNGCNIVSQWDDTNSTWVEHLNSLTA